MTATITSFIKEIEPVRKKVNAVNSRQIQSVQLRDEIRNLIENYFKIIRPTILSNAANNDDIRRVDEQMQELLVLCHKAGSKNGYSIKLVDIRKLLISIDSKILSYSPNEIISDNSVDSQIISTLGKILPSAALSYQQAIIDLKEDNRHSWRGPATDLRESLRETLDHLAPDKEVQAMPSYKQEKETSGPTMKQKVRFILSKRGISKTQSSTAESAIESIESTVGTFVRSVYTRSSISTHTPTDKNEIIRIKNYTRATLCELLEINT